MGTRIELDREATQERLQVRMYELIVRYMETADRLIVKNPEMKRDAFLRDGELQKILLQINSIIGLMEGMKGDVGRAMREKSVMEFRGYRCWDLMIKMLILSMEFTQPGHGDKGMLCATWHACVPEIVRKMREEGYWNG